MYEFFLIEIILISNHVLYVCVRGRESGRACHTRAILQIHLHASKPSPRWTLGARD